MNWNPYNRIAELEALHAKNIAVLAALATRIDILGQSNAAQARWLSSLEARLQDSSPVAISRADVEKEAKARLKRAAYARKYYANKRAEKAKAAAAGDAK